MNRNPASAPRPARRRRWWFPLAALLVIPVTLIVLEGVLRLLGAGYATSYFVVHPAVPTGTRVENQRFPWRFFPPTLARHPDPVLLTPRKAPGTYRIFVFGESAAEGDPAPAFGVARQLEVLLGERHPGMRFEVVNTAFTAISSHVILPIARECASIEGDLWIVYMGNNEVIGPGGSATVFGSRTLPTPLLHASLTLKTTRTGQLLEALVGAIHRSPEAAQGWGGMSMFLNHQVAADDPRLESVYARFQQNLDHLLGAARRAGVPVIVSTVAVNLRDNAPFGSQHRPGLTADALSAWQRHHDTGVAAAGRGEWAAALDAWDEAARLDDRVADLWFRRGTALLAQGRNRDARTAFEQARDLDTLRFRTDRRLNRILRETASARVSQGVRFVDAEQAFADATGDGIPGDEWFYEHVHFRFAGNYRLARTLADAIVPHLPPALTNSAAVGAAWLDEAGCARRLGWSAGAERDVLMRVASRLAEPIYRRQLNDVARQARVTGRLEALRGEAKPTARRRAAQELGSLVARHPADWRLHELLARSLAAADQPEAALAAWNEVAVRLPHDPTAPFESGQLLLESGSTAEAGTAFRRALELNPDHARSHESLGLLCAREGRAAEARRHLRAAVRLDPTRVAAARALAPADGTASPGR